MILLLGAGTLWIAGCKTQKPVATIPAAPVVQPQPKFALKNENDSISYSIGVSIGQSLKGQGLDSIHLDVLTSALKSSYGNDSLLIGKEQANQFLSSYFQNLQMKKAEVGKKVGQQFLAENKTKPGIITLPSGLQYQVLKEGTGAKPKATDKVKAHYKGTLLDGTVFDSSYERKEPLNIGVTEVIPGWTEALQLMSIGSKWKLFVPSDLAYGERGAGHDIPPHSALVFEIELISIDSAAAA
ncbi:MAG: FKBP-type peptidyl-prolyl cis-trans isomerase, partial [Bacteroidota bacterium]